MYQVAAWLLLLVPVAVERLHNASKPWVRKCWAVAAAVGTVAAAGANELTIIQLGLVMALGAGLSTYRRQWFSLRVWSGLGLLLLIAGAFSVLAPGNTSRQVLDVTLAPATSSWQVATRLVVLLRYLFVEPSLLLIPFLTLILGPLAVRVLPARPPGLRIPLLVSAALLVSGVIISTIPYAMMWARVPLIPRATNALVWWWLLGWMVAIWASLPAEPAGVTVASRPVRLLLGIVLLITMAVPSVRAYLDLYHEAPEFARQWQARFELMQQAGRQAQPTLEVPPLPPLTDRGLLFPPDDMGPVYNHGVNNRLAAWFGVDSIRVKLP